MFYSGLPQLSNWLFISIDPEGKLNHWLVRLRWIIRRLLTLQTHHDQCQRSLKFSDVFSEP